MSVATRLWTGIRAKGRGLRELLRHCAWIASASERERSAGGRVGMLWAPQLPGGRGRCGPTLAMAGADKQWERWMYRYGDSTVLAWTVVGIKGGVQTGRRATSLMGAGSSDTASLTLNVMQPGTPCMRPHDVDHRELWLNISSHSIWRQTLVGCVVFLNRSNICTTATLASYCANAEAQARALRSDCTQDAEHLYSPNHDLP